MKFNCHVEINQPIEKVITLFDNPDNMKYWQDGFVSFKHLSGREGEVGAKSKIHYNTGKREFDLIETITTKNLPHELSGTYEHIHMTNTMVNRFKSISADQTRWDAEIEYTSITHFMAKIMAFLMPGMFKKQTQKWMDQFKDFAEGKRGA